MDQNKLKTITVVTVVLFAAFIYQMFTWGFVIYKFWVWFAMPVFVDLQHINIYQAMGLGVFINVFHFYSEPLVLKEEYIDRKTKNITVIISPWIVLLMGCLVKIIFL